MKLFLLFDLIFGLCPSMAPETPDANDIFQLTQTSSLYDGKFSLYTITFYVFSKNRPCITASLSHLQSSAAKLFYCKILSQFRVSEKSIDFFL